MLAEVRGAAPYAGLSEELFGQVLSFIESGGYALRAYDKFKRLTRERGRDLAGQPPALHPAAPDERRHHRRRAALRRPLPRRAQARHGRGRFRRDAVARRHLLLRRAGARGREDRRHRPDRPRHAPNRRASRPIWARAWRCRPTSPSASAISSTTASNGRASPTTCATGCEVQDYRSTLPAPDELLVETFPHEQRHYMVAYSFEGWNAHQSLGMLITRRMESAGLRPLGFVSNDYALAVYGLDPIDGSGRALLGRHPRARVRRLGAGLEPAEARLPRGGGDRRAGRAPPSGQAQDRGGRSPSRPTSSTTCCAATSPTTCCSRPPGPTRARG